MLSVLTSEAKSLTIPSLHRLLCEMQKVVHQRSREHGDKHAREVLVWGCGWRGKLKALIR